MTCQSLFMMIDHFNCFVFHNFRNIIETYKNKSQQLCISTSNKPLTNFLITHDYTSKNNASADKILSHIPKNLHHYWFRGLVDGDECFYINNKRKCYQVSISSSFDQNWNYIETLFQTLDIPLYVVRRKQLQQQKTNKSSYIRITNKSDIIKFGKYIYNGYNNDHMGLSRKYKKFQNIYTNDVQQI